MTKRRRLMELLTRMADQDGTTPLVADLHDSLRQELAGLALMLNEHRDTRAPREFGTRARNRGAFEPGGVACSPLPLKGVL